MPDDLIVRDNAAQLLKNAPEQPESFSFAQRLSLEGNLLLGGAKDGFMDRLQQARENPGVTALEFTAAAAIGAGLTAMHQAGGRWGVAANIAGTGLKWVAIGDVVRRGAPTAYAMVDTMINPNNYLENRGIVASNLGGALFDYPLMAAGGMLGSKAVTFGPKAISSLSDRFKGVSNEAPTLPKNFDANALSKFGKVPDFGNAKPPAELGIKGDTPTNSLKGNAGKLPAPGEIPLNNPGIKLDAPVNNAGIKGADFNAIKASDGPFNNNAKPSFEIPGKTIKPFEINRPDFMRINPPKFNFDIVARSATSYSFAPIIPLPLVEKEFVLQRIEKFELPQKIEKK